MTAMDKTFGVLIVVALATWLNVKDYKREAAAKRAAEDSLVRDLGWRVVTPQSKLRKGFRGLARFLKERRNERAN